MDYKELKDTPSEKNSQNNTLIIAGSIIIAGILVAGALMMKGDSVDAEKKVDIKDKGGETVEKTLEPEPSEPVDMVALMDDDAVKGEESAPVTIVEFSDFECPYCSRFYSQTLSQIEENYIDTGKVKMVHRDYPLPFHGNAQKAAEATECADDQGKFWEMHDMLYENNTALSVDNIKGYAAELGLNTGDFDSCLDSGKYYDEVQKDMADGSAAGVTGTPGFLINGELVVGAQPYAVFEQAIEKAL